MSRYQESSVREATPQVERRGLFPCCEKNSVIVIFIYVFTRTKNGTRSEFAHPSLPSFLSLNEKRKVKSSQANPPNQLQTPPYSRRSATELQCRDCVLTLGAEAYSRSSWRRVLMPKTRKCIILTSKRVRSFGPVKSSMWYMLGMLAG